MCHTEPSQGIHSGQHWNQGQAGIQYSDSSLSTNNGFSHDAFPVPFATYHMTEDSLLMSRQDSTGAHSARTNHSSVALSYNQAQSGSMFPSLSQTSYPMSSTGSDGSPRSNSPDYTPTPQTTNFLENYTYYGDAVAHEQKGSTSGLQSHMLTDVPFSNGFSLDEDNYFSTYIQDHDMITKEASLYQTDNSPTLFDNNFLEPVPPLIQDEMWHLPPSQMRSPSASSPSEESHSPLAFTHNNSEIPHAVVRSSRKTGPRQSKVNSDIARNTRPTGTSEASDEYAKYSGRTSDADNHARDHELYHNAAPRSDGLYHCPWEGQECCQHRPEKLKCNYDKFVDSHLKPYRCKISQCGELRFSSTACLLRHEREAHAMHGHGEKPFLCEYENCERAIPGNGFPRHWNLRDHMRRVHNDAGAPKSSISGGSPPAAAPALISARSKKRKHEKPSSSTVGKGDKSIKSRSKRESRETSSVEVYQETYERLMVSVQRLKDPRNTDYDQLFTETFNDLDSLRETAQAVHSYYHIQD